mgnify:CR=1 FL=1
MPLELTIRTDQRFDDLVANLEAFPDYWPAIVREHLPELGKRIVEIMREMVDPNRYTGGLQDSIESVYDDGEQTVTINPTVMRGQWDGGLILEMGTGPIPNAPYAPIRAWADFRGIPAFPVWYKIREEGVAAHPFIDRTLDAADEVIAETGRRMASAVADTVLTGTGTVSK